jgi:hypothetical protein
MSNKFETDDQVQEILENLKNARRKEEAEDAIAAAYKLSPDARAYVGGVFEKEVVLPFLTQFSSPEVIQKTKAWAAEVTRMRNLGPLTLAIYQEQLDSLEELKILSDLFLFTAESRQSQASPFIKAFAAEAAKIPSQENEWPEHHLNAIATAVEKAQTNLPIPTAPKKITTESPKADLAETRLKTLKSRAPGKIDFKKK